MPQPTGVFISYRRIDSQATAGRLSDDLKRAFGDDAVFRDIDDIAPGVDFIQALADALNACAVLLAVIGPAWLEQLQRRAEGGDATIDHVRSEIETALSSGIKVIPVLLESATVPNEQSLPQSLQGLGRLQGHSQNDKSWRYDLGLLLPRLEALTGRKADDPFKRGSAWLRSLRQSPVKLVSRRSGAIAAAAGSVALLTIGGMQWMEQEAYLEGDVAFLIPPERQEGADAEDAVRVFYAIQGALNLALQDPHFDVVPESVSADDFDRYRFDRKQTLLQYKTPQGYARVFIRTAYGVDRQTGTRRMLVTPYLRPTGDSKNWTEAEGWWRDRAFVGPLNSKPLAIQVSFELIEFLAAKGLIRLDSAGVRQARLTLLNEYRSLLEISAVSCEAVQALLPELRDAERRSVIANTVKSTRRALETYCAWPDQTADVGSADIRTAAAVYSKALGI